MGILELYRSALKKWTGIKEKFVIIDLNSDDLELFVSDNIIQPCAFCNEVDDCDDCQINPEICNNDGRGGEFYFFINNMYKPDQNEVLEHINVMIKLMKKEIKKLEDCIFF